jgi:uncharacterized alkaline shock family protein YloU
MRGVHQLNIGSVHVHKNALSDIISSAVSGIEGVRLIPKNFADDLMEILGQRKFPGIEIHIDENNEVTVDLKVYIRYGMNISDIANQIQDVVKSILDRTVDIHLREINVSVQGIERGET